MHIKLNVLADGTCAQIYATPDLNEKRWINKSGRSIDAVKIWHNDKTNSIDAFPSPLNNCDNDFYVTFHSEIPFSRFCTKFAASEYNKAGYYNKFHHNCANAAYYALKIARIELPTLPRVKWMKIVSYITFPGPVLTPLRLFEMACQYKDKMHRLQKSPDPDFEVGHAISAFGFWARNNKQENVLAIFSETRKMVKARPHHVELYMDMLKAINVFDFETQNKKQLDEIANLFMEREKPISVKVIEQYVILYLFTLGLKFILIILDNFTSSQQLNLLEIGEKFVFSFDWKGDLLCALLFSYINLFWKLTHDTIPKRMETNLSQAIRNLLKEPTVEGQVDLTSDKDNVTGNLGLR